MSMTNTETRIPTAKEVADMLEKAVAHYGNRPVKIEVNGHLAIVNDLRFEVHGNDYVLCFTGNKSEKEENYAKS